MAVTIKQIAELANVSRGTVDKVLNNRPGVKKETRDKVLKIAKELNYEPNVLGKALVQRQNPVTLGIILTPEHNPFIQDMLLGIQNAQQEYSAYGLNVVIKMPISLEPAEQISILSDLELNGVKGVALFPIDDDAVRAKINQLTETGIPILTCNSNISGINNFFFIGQDHVQGGRTAAGLMEKLLPDGGKLGVIISSYNLSCHKDRLSGFTERLRHGNASYDILDIQENQDRKDEAFKLTLSLLNQHPDLDGIYVTGGGIGGVGSALDIASPKKRIKVVCHDLTPDSIDMLKDGTLDFVIGQDPVFQGYYIVKLLFEHLVLGRKPEMDWLKVPITISTADTIEQAL